MGSRRAAAAGGSPFFRFDLTPYTGFSPVPVHGTQKPVECMRRPIENNASPGQAVYEPFSGSGNDDNRG